MSGQGSSGCCLCATLAMAKRKSQGPPRTLCKTWHPCHRRVAPGPHLDDSIDSAMPCRVSVSPGPTAFQADGIGRSKAQAQGQDRNRSRKSMRLAPLVASCSRCS